MNTRRLASGILCLMFLGSCYAMAQVQAGVSLPKILWIYREDIKPARGAVHDRVEQGFAQLWAKAHVQPFLGLEAVSGNASESIFLSGYGSLEDYEKDFQTFSKTAEGPLKAEYEALEKQEAELVNSVRSIIAVYRPDLSYRMDPSLAGLPKARLMQITTIRIRIGKDEPFATGIKTWRSGFEKLNAPRPWAVYQVASGAPEGTYLVLQVMRSLKEIDEDIAMAPKLAETIGADALRDMLKGMSDTFISMENSIYAFNPRISNVPKAFADADPEFWAPKAKTAQKPSAEPKKP